VQNNLCHSCCVGQNIGVPEPQHSPAPLFQPFSSMMIMCVVSVLRAVCLNGQQVLCAREIQDKRPDRELPPKLIPTQLSAPQNGPEPSLGVGGPPA
jgi:hypothetical protein